MDDENMSSYDRNKRLMTCCLSNLKGKERKTEVKVDI